MTIQQNSTSSPSSLLSKVSEWQSQLKPLRTCKQHRIVAERRWGQIDEHVRGVQIRGGGATPGLCGEWVSPAPQQIGCIRTLASRSSKLQDNRRTGSGKQRSDGRGGGEDHSFQSAPPTRSTQNCSPAGLPTNKQQQLTPRNPQQTIMVAAPSKGQAEVILVGA